MIQDLEIQNFRCFEKLKVSGFGKVNLISGKNNAGKTALLEALFLNCSPTFETIYLVRQVRQEPLDFLKELPERAWNNLFFNQDKSKQLIIATNSIDGYYKPVELSVDSSVDESIKFENDEKFTTMISSIHESVRSILHLKTFLNSGEEIFETSVISSSKGLGHITTSPTNPNINRPTFFVPSALRLSNKALTIEYDKARFNNKDAEILNAFQIIDPSIIEVTSFSIGEPTIYLKRENQERLPLGLFGDAIIRIADIILKIVNHENCTLLIDEIENGIHYTTHENFWNILFKLVQALNVQIFCTTHSLEMMQAFVKAGEKYKDFGAHFELARHAKSGNIVAIRRDLETLGYGIEHHKGVRGE